MEAGEHYDVVIAIGRLPMMKAVSEMTRPYGIKTIVSLNTIMIDGTGMRRLPRHRRRRNQVTCVDGPDFDGHLVDFDSPPSAAACTEAGKRPPGSGISAA